MKPTPLTPPIFPPPHENFSPLPMIVSLLFQLILIDKTKPAKTQTVKDVHKGITV